MTFGYQVLGFGAHHRGGFSPDDISGLELWYDSSDITTLWTDDGTTQVSSDGDLIYRWDDKSGNGGHAKQSVSANRPSYKINAGGNATSLLFDGADWLNNVDHIPAFGSGDTYPITMIAIFANSLVSGNDTQIGVASSTSNWPYWRLFLSDATPDDQYFQVAGNTGSEAIISTSTTVGDGNNHIAIGVTYSNTSRDIWVDGGDHASGTASAVRTIDPNVVSIGRLSRLTPIDTCNGYILELAVYDSALSTADREDFEAYATSKWGI